jgi:cyclopropane fatty-acyl-phospholipid synthase-like methyltransferase
VAWAWLPVPWGFSQLYNSGFQLDVILTSY